MRARADRRHAREAEGARRLPGGGPRKRPELTRAARRREAARLDHLDDAQRPGFPRLQDFRRRSPTPVLSCINL